MIRPQPKPARHGPKARKRISRQAPVRRRSSRRPAVERADARWAEQVKARDGMCVLGRLLRDCMGPQDAHHAFYGKKAHPSLRHEVENGARVCRRHHDFWHAHPKLLRLWWADKHPDWLRHMDAKANA